LLQACLEIRQYLAALQEAPLRQYLSDNGMQFDADEEQEGLELAANRSLQPLVESVALSLLEASTVSLQASARCGATLQAPGCLAADLFLCRCF
jgi:hypothetical protein